MSYPRQIVTGFTRRKPRHVRQTRSFWLAAFGMLILSHIAGAQPLGINPSAAPSDLGNPSSIPPEQKALGIDSGSQPGCGTRRSGIVQVGAQHLRIFAILH